MLPRGAVLHNRRVSALMLLPACPNRVLRGAVDPGHGGEWAEDSAPRGLSPGIGCCRRSIERTQHAREHRGVVDHSSGRHARHGAQPVRAPSLRVRVGVALDLADFAWILRDCDHPQHALASKPFTRTLDPKGFWRVDKAEDPELRHTVLSLVASRAEEARPRCLPRAPRRGRLDASRDAPARRLRARSRRPCAGTAAGAAPSRRALPSLADRAVGRGVLGGVPAARGAHREDRGAGRKRRLSACS